MMTFLAPWLHCAATLGFKHLSEAVAAVTCNNRPDDHTVSARQQTSGECTAENPSLACSQTVKGDLISKSTNLYEQTTIPTHSKKSTHFKVKLCIG